MDDLTERFESGQYWRNRSDLLYYQYFRYIMRVIATEAESVIDVGTGNTPYLEWFDWIPKRVSVDMRVPYKSDTVQGIVGDIHELEFPERFDICTCMQVLEHVPDVEPFAKRLLELGKLFLISVPYKWPEGTPDHVHDPVDEVKLKAWFGRSPNYKLVVKEPFGTKKGNRLFAIYDPSDPERRFPRQIVNNRRPL